MGMLQKPTEATPLVAAPPAAAAPAPMSRAARRLFINYLCFAVAFGCSYGSLKASTAYLSTIFPQEAAARANALQYALWMLASLLVAAAVVSRIGSKAGLVGAQVLVAFYHSCLLIACLLGPTTVEAHALVLMAGSIGGLASAHMWTAQGAYFARAARAYAFARGDGLSVGETTAWLSSLFATTFLTIEVTGQSFTHGIPAQPSAPPRIPARSACVLSAPPTAACTAPRAVQVTARCGAATFVLLGSLGASMYALLLGLAVFAACASSCLIDVDQPHAEALEVRAGATQ